MPVHHDENYGASKGLDLLELYVVWFMLMRFASSQVECLSRHIGKANKRVTGAALVGGLRTKSALPNTSKFYLILI